MSVDFDVAPYGGTCNQLEFNQNKQPAPPSKHHVTREDHIDELEKKRTILTIESVLPKDTENIPKYIFGFVLYVFIFVMIIPYILVKNNVPTEFLLAYMPNVDILATILGYNGGPVNDIWRYLYNPTNFTFFGFIFVTLLNYMALLGVTFVVAKDTIEHRSWEYGWAATFICLMMTYLLPGNALVIAQNEFEKYLEKAGIMHPIKHRTPRYVVMTLLGLVLATILIVCEAMVIRFSRPHIVSIIKKVTNWLR